MPKFAVEILARYRYSEVMTVEADNPEEAKAVALEEWDPCVVASDMEPLGIWASLRRRLPEGEDEI